MRFVRTVLLGTRVSKLLAPLALLLPLAACAGEPPATDAPPRIVDIVGHDFSYEMPAEVPAGWTTFRFENRGEEPHHATVVRLAGEATVESVLEALGRGEPLGPDMVAAGGPNAVMTGDTSRATVELMPGRYAVICFIPSPDGVPHVMKGMVQGFRVTEAAGEGSDGAGAAEPEADVTLEMVDYAYRQSAVLEPGRRTIRVENAAEDRLHEVVLARVAEGRTAQDVVDWVMAFDAGEEVGPPPAEFLGGVAGLRPGGINYFTVELEPGAYVWLCPMVDSPGQPSHLHQGMFLPFRVG